MPATPTFVIGACEWVGLPELDIAWLRARVDTGAKTSSLHASEITGGDAGEIEFTVHIGSPKTQQFKRCRASLVDERSVTNPGGRREIRPVIRTTIRFGATSWPIEITLTDRSDMRYRMLLGRSALSGRCLIDPTHAYLHGHPGYTGAPPASDETRGKG